MVMQALVRVRDPMTINGGAHEPNLALALKTALEGSLFEHHGLR